MEITRFQKLIRDTYIHHDSRRGLDNTVEWFLSEVYEFIKALNGEGDIEEEAADVAAWLVSIMNLLNIDLDNAVRKRYGEGCPKCISIPCRCDYRETPDKKVRIEIRNQ